MKQQQKHHYRHQQHQHQQNKNNSNNKNILAITDPISTNLEIITITTETITKKPKNNNTFNKTKKNNNKSQLVSTLSKSFARSRVGVDIIGSTGISSNQSIAILYINS